MRGWVDGVELRRLLTKSGSQLWDRVRHMQVVKPHSGRCLNSKMTGASEISGDYVFPCQGANSLLAASRSPLFQARFRNPEPWTLSAKPYNPNEALAGVDERGP